MRDPLFRMALVLGLLSAVGPFAIDMYLPALPQVADVAARALQALGAATLMAVPRAVIRDMASGPEAARMMAAIMIVISISPMLAPLTGSMVLALGSWRAIFAVLAAASLVSLTLIALVLPETLRPEDRRPVRLGALLSGAGRLLSNRSFLGLTMIGGFGMSSFFVFLATGSFVYTREFGLSPTGFSIAFALNAIGFFSASQLAGRLSARFGKQRLITVAVGGFAAATLLLAALGWAGLASLPVVVGGLFVANAFLGLVIPTAMVLALDPHPDIAGLASSLGGTIQMLTGGAMIVVTGLVLDNSAASMTLAIALCGVLAWVAAALSLPRSRALA